MNTEIPIKSRSRTEFINITGEVQKTVDKSGIKEGICYMFVPHTTAGITINEAADPDVVSDIQNELDKMAPYSDHYQHTEGNADSHIKTSIVGASELVFIENGKLRLGTWQGIFLCEFDGPRNRKVWVKIV
ncbi:MAG: YjbQ family protein [Nitrospinae bacterium]|nr:YjbQ family protein [Nitrospinota bacterium]